MIRVQEADFDVGVELARLSEGRRDIGGLACFIGLVRDRVGESVTAMTLEHYPGMTEKRLAEIEAEALARWPLAATLIIHRVGRLLPGDRIVLVATASSHRQAALESCQFLIDWLKTKAPFGNWRRRRAAPNGSMPATATTRPRSAGADPESRNDHHRGRSCRIPNSATSARPRRSPLQVAQALAGRADGRADRPGRGGRTQDQRLSDQAFRARDVRGQEGRGPVHEDRRAASAPRGHACAIKDETTIKGWRSPSARSSSRTMSTGDRTLRSNASSRPAPSSMPAPPRRNSPARPIPIRGSGA